MENPKQITDDLSSRDNDELLFMASMIRLILDERKVYYPSRESETEYKGGSGCNVKYSEIEDWEKPCLLEIQQFYNSIKMGMGTDGSGYYSDGVMKVYEKVNLDNLNFDYTHVIWYDK